MVPRCVKHLARQLEQRVERRCCVGLVIAFKGRKEGVNEAHFCGGPLVVCTELHILADATGRAGDGAEGRGWRVGWGG
jgi:hypothetical protein